MVSENIVNEFATTANKSAATGLANKAVDFMIHKLSEKHQKITIESGTAFITYLNNTFQELNFKKTLASGDISLRIIGEKSMYVDIGAYYCSPDRQEPIAVDTSSVPALLSVNPNADKIIVVGTGGAGKSMLMRYLFLDTVNRNAGDFVPIYMELSKVKSKEQIIDMCSFVRDSMDSYGKIDLSGDVFEYSLEQGGYVFLFDGFDEIKEELTISVIDALQKFSAKYPNNAFIISSRERLALQSLSAFQTVHSLTLSLDKAIALAEKFPGEQAKVSIFCENLRETWYNSHKEFAENPLLLTMMFITFKQNGDISNCLADFYQDCFDALYSKHDAVDKTGFQRAFHCDISKHEFQKVFSHFCFHTWHREIYNFSEDEILVQLANSIQKFNLHISEEDYLKDLTESLCLVTFEGHRYRFAHRSFQTYFAAKYTCTLSDEQQNEFLTKKFDLDCENYDTNYLTLLDQLEHERFLNNWVEPLLKNIISEYDLEQKFSLKIVPVLFISENHVLSTPISYTFIAQVTSYITSKIFYPRLTPESKHKECFCIVQQLSHTCKAIREAITMSPIPLCGDAFEIDMNEFLESIDVSENDKNIIYEYILEECQIPKMYQTIKDWLSEREALHQRESQVQDFDDFFDSL